MVGVKPARPRGGRWGSCDLGVDCIHVDFLILIYTIRRRSVAHPCHISSDEVEISVAYNYFNLAVAMQPVFRAYLEQSTLNRNNTVYDAIICEPATEDIRKAVRMWSSCLCKSCAQSKIVRVKLHHKIFGYSRET